MNRSIDPGGRRSCSRLFAAVSFPARCAAGGDTPKVGIMQKAMRAALRMTAESCAAAGPAAGASRGFRIGCGFHGHGCFVRMQWPRPHESRVQPLRFKGCKPRVNKHCAPKAAFM